MSSQAPFCQDRVEIGRAVPLRIARALHPGAETPSRRTRRIRWILDGTDVISERGRTRRKTPEEHHVWPRLEAMKRHMARGEDPCGGMTHSRPTPPTSGAGAGYCRRLDWPAGHEMGTEGKVGDTQSPCRRPGGVKLRAAERWAELTVPSD